MCWHRCHLCKSVHAMDMFSVQLQHMPEHTGMMFRVDPSEEMSYRASMLSQFIRAVSRRVAANCNLTEIPLHCTVLFHIGVVFFELISINIAIVRFRVKHSGRLV